MVRPSTQVRPRFASSKPVGMWDTKTLALIKTSTSTREQPGRHSCRPFNQRIYVLSHRPGCDGDRRRTVGSARSIATAARNRRRRWEGSCYVVIREPCGDRCQDDEGHCALRFRRQGQPVQRAGAGCQNHVLFAACGQSGIPAVTPPQPMMVILNAG